MTPADALSDLLLDQVSAALTERGVEHGPLVEGRPFLNLNASDGDRVFVKVSRVGERSKRQAAELAGATWARRHGIATPVPSWPMVLGFDDGARRNVTVWEHLRLHEPPSLSRQCAAMIDLVARVGAVAAPVSAEDLDLGSFMDRVVIRLRGRRDPQAEQIRRQALESWGRVTERMARVGWSWIHGDLHLRNVGWLADGSPVLLDWESHARGPVEWDAAQVLRSVLVFAEGLDAAERERAAARVARILDDRLDLDWDLVTEVVRFRSASSASHLLVHGHDADVLERDLALMTCDLDWLRPGAPVAEAAA